VDWNKKLVRLGDNMKCPKCGSDELKYDELSEMYYCSGCNSLLDKSEVKLEYFDKLIEEDELTEFKEWEDESEDLSEFNLVVLSMLQCVPIVGIVVPLLVQGSAAKREYKRQFGSMFIAHLIICMFAVIFACIFLKGVKLDITASYQLNGSKLINLVSSNRGKTITQLMEDIPKGVSKEILMEFTNTTQVEETPTEMLSSINLDLLDGCIVTGTKAMSIVKDTSSCNLAYLLQNEDIATRHGKDSYRNVGTILTSAVNEGTGTQIAYYVNMQDTFSYYTNDYGAYITDSTKDFENKKYIFYVNPKSDYTIKVLYDVDGNCVGLAFKER
jgi:hypothetical protein